MVLLWVVSTTFIYTVWADSGLVPGPESVNILTSSVCYECCGFILKTGFDYWLLYKGL